MNISPSLLLISSSQGPRSNFEIGKEGGGGTFVTRHWGGGGGEGKHKTLFLY